VVTLYDVAEHAGVSIATVSRVLHGVAPVRESTQAKVRAAIDELGYVPDGAAQSLARNRKDVIGLVGVEHTGLNPDQHDIESMSLLFYAEVMLGVEARIRERSWSLLITFLREEETLGTSAPEDEQVQSRLFALSGKVDGLLIVEGVVPHGMVASLAKRVPVVVVAGDTAQRRADVVAADNWSGAHALVEHLVRDHGRRRLFHIDGPPTAPDAKERRTALEAVIDAHPGAELTGSYNGRFSVASGRVGATALLDSGGPLPDAIVCANDQMAIGALRALTERGIRVPEDVALVGFDDIFPASLCDPPLTTVLQPIRKIGERASDRLIERITEPTLRPRVELLPAELALRASCGCPPGTVKRIPVLAVPRRKPATVAKPGVLKPTAAAAKPAATAHNLRITSAEPVLPTRER